MLNNVTSVQVTLREYKLLLHGDFSAGLFVNVYVR